MSSKISSGSYENESSTDLLEGSGLGADSDMSVVSESVFSSFRDKHLIHAETAPGLDFKILTQRAHSSSFNDAEGIRTDGVKGYKQNMTINSPASVQLTETSGDAPYTNTTDSLSSNDERVVKVMKKFGKRAVKFKSLLNSANGEIYVGIHHCPKQLEYINWAQEEYADSNDPVKVTPEKLFHFLGVLQRRGQLLKKDDIVVPHNYRSLRNYIDRIVSLYYQQVFDEKEKGKFKAELWPNPENFYKIRNLLTRLQNQPSGRNSSIECETKASDHAFVYKDFNFEEFSSINLKLFIQLSAKALCTQLVTHSCITTATEVRNTCFADFRVETVKRQDLKNVECIVLSSRRGYKKSMTKESIMLRHEDVFNCGISALAFNFFVQYMVNEEPFIDLSSPNSLYNFKVTAASNDPEKSYFSAVHRFKLIAAYKSYGWTFTKSMIGIRDSKNVVEESGISAEDLENFLLQKEHNVKSEEMLYDVAKVMAGFGLDETYKCIRDQNLPDEELRGKIFPQLNKWIDRRKKGDLGKWIKMNEVIKVDDAEIVLSKKERIRTVENCIDLFSYLRKVIIQDLVYWKVALEDGTIDIPKNHDIINHAIFRSSLYNKFLKRQHTHMNQQQSSPTKVTKARSQKRWATAKFQTESSISSDEYSSSKKRSNLEMESEEDTDELAVKVGKKNIKETSTLTHRLRSRSRDNGTTSYHNVVNDAIDDTKANGKINNDLLRLFGSTFTESETTEDKEDNAENEDDNDDGQEEEDDLEFDDGSSTISRQLKEIKKYIHNLSKTVKKNNDTVNKRIGVLEKNIFNLQKSFYYFADSMYNKGVITTDISNLMSSKNTTNSKTTQNKMQGRSNDKKSTSAQSNGSTDNDESEQELGSPMKIHILGTPDSIKLIYKEFKYGIRDNPSLLKLDEVYGDEWRRSRTISRKYATRFIIYRYIENLSRNMSEEEAIAKAEKSRIIQGEKKSVEWLVDHLRLDDYM